MRHLLEESPVGHFICNDFGKFEYMNPALARLAGRTPQDMIEERLQLNDLFQRTNGEALGKEYEYRDTKEEVILLTSDNRSTRLHLELSLIRDGNKVTAIVGTVTKD